MKSFTTVHSTLSTILSYISTAYGRTDFFPALLQNDNPRSVLVTPSVDLDQWAHLDSTPYLLHVDQKGSPCCCRIYRVIPAGYIRCNAARITLRYEH